MRVSGVRDIFHPPRMASHAKGWRNVAEILWNCWSAFSLGFLSSSGSPKRFLLLWTHYGRRSHLVLCNGKTHRKQNMHGQEGMPWRCPCCLSLYKPFPQCLRLPTPAESCLLTKLMVCPVSHPPMPCPPGLRPRSISGHHPSTVSFASTRTLAIATSPIAHVQVWEGPPWLGICCRSLLPHLGEV